MNDPVPLDPDSWSPALARRVERECSRFEADWKAGRKPLLENFLNGIEPPERAILLAELLLIELGYRDRQGERPRVN